MRQEEGSSLRPSSHNEAGTTHPSYSSYSHNFRSAFGGDEVKSFAEPTYEDSPTKGLPGEGPSSNQWRKRVTDASGSTQGSDKEPIESWTKLSTTLHQYDKDKIKDCKEDIDTLLVFAGLYSAVLTAFIIEAFKLLQQDYTQISAQLLFQVSQQVASFVITNNAINATQIFPPTPISAFRPATSSIRVNALWFSSLICSLVTASLGILVKQWLREYVAGEYVSAKERCRVRYIRRLGLLKYRVFEIAAFLPLLIQFSLILFFVGLMEFVRPVNTLVFWIITSLVTAWVVFYASTTFAPAFSPSCPYKTPFLRSLLPKVRHSLEPVRLWLHAITNKDISREEYVLRNNQFLDEAVLLDADKTFRDGEVFRTIVGCLSDGEWLRAPTSTMRRLMEQRTGRPASQITRRSFRCFQYSERVTMLSALIRWMQEKLQDHYRDKTLSFWDPSTDATFTYMTHIYGSLEPATVSLRRDIKHVFESLLLFPGNESTTAGLVTRMAKLQWMPHFSPDVGLVSDEVLNAVLRGAGTILQTPGHIFDAMALWGTVCMMAKFTDPADFQGCRHQFVGLMRKLTPRILEDSDPPLDLDTRSLAERYHIILGTTVRFNETIPGILDQGLLDALDLRCLRVFRRHVEERGYTLQSWDELTSQPVPLHMWHTETVYSVMKEEPELGEEWRVRKLRSNWNYRWRFLDKLQSGRPLDDICGGGVEVRRPL